MRGLIRLEGVETKVDFIDHLHPSIMVKTESRPRDPQRWAFVLDAPRPEICYSVHNNSLNNLLRGLNERVFYTDNNCTPSIKPLEGGFNALDVFTREFKPFRSDVWSLEKFVESFVGSRRSRYQRAVDSLALMPLTDRDARVSTFVKCEKINFSAKTDPAPRVIQPRDPRFNASIGRFVKPMEHLIYRQLGKLYSGPVIAKGFDIYQLGDMFHTKWQLFKAPCAVGLDASRFDQHCSVEALKWTHSIYHKFCDDEEFKSLLNMLLVNRGHASAKDGFVKYVIEGCRMSGDMDTALGNCLLMTAMTYSLCKTLGINHEVMNNGDDMVVIMESGDLEQFLQEVPGWFESLGFKMKVEPPVYELEEIEFCQMHPVFDGEEWRMVRNLSALSKDLMCSSAPEQISSWIRAVGQGGLSLYEGLPVYDAFYRWLSKFGKVKHKAHKHVNFTSSGMAIWMPKRKRIHYGIKPEARASFTRAFKMEFPQQFTLEWVYGQLDTGPLGINHTCFDSDKAKEFNSSFLF